MAKNNYGYVTDFHIYMKANQKAGPGDIVVIDGKYSFPLEIVDYQNPLDNSNDTGDLLGYVTHITERESDNDYYIEGKLLNFGMFHKETPMNPSNPGELPIFNLEIGKPRTSIFGPSNHLSYSERTSNNFRVLTKEEADPIKEKRPSWFI